MEGEKDVGTTAGNSRVSLDRIGMTAKSKDDWIVDSGEAFAVVLNDVVICCLDLRTMGVLL